jgi:hypothetical protein
MIATGTGTQQTDDGVGEKKLNYLGEALCQLTAINLARLVRF